MATTKVVVKIPDDIVGKEVAKQIKSLEGKIKRLEDKNDKLVAELNTNMEIVKKAQNIMKAVKDIGEFFDWDEMNERC